MGPGIPGSGRDLTCLWGTTSSNHLTALCLNFSSAKSGHCSKSQTHSVSVSFSSLEGFPRPGLPQGLTAPGLVRLLSGLLAQTGQGSRKKR